MLPRTSHFIPTRTFYPKEDISSHRAHLHELLPIERIFFSFFSSCFMSICNSLGYDRPTLCALYLCFPAWPKVLYFSTISALSRRISFVALGLPLLSSIIERIPSHQKHLVPPSASRPILCALHPTKSILFPRAHLTSLLCVSFLKFGLLFYCCAVQFITVSLYNISDNPSQEFKIIHVYTP